MSLTVALPPNPITYPESDGKPMADNTKQFEWISVLYGNIAALFHDRQDVFVCGNQLWYPVQGEPTIVCAPDVYAVFGRPKGYRGSYKQWQENDVPMTVVFEVLSPSNDTFEMIEKFHFYDDHGVEEYYLIDPEKNGLIIYTRGDATLSRKLPAHNFVSPRMNIRFDLSGDEMVVRYPDGRPFLSFEQLESERQRLQQRLARLAELSLKLIAGQASEEEKQELARLAAAP